MSPFVYTRTCQCPVSQLYEREKKLTSEVEMKVAIMSVVALISATFIEYLITRVEPMTRANSVIIYMLMFLCLNEIFK